nr:phosphoribosylformylglycinamidine synthase [Ipomoea batatas]
MSILVNFSWKWDEWNIAELRGRKNKDSSQFQSILLKKTFEKIFGRHFHEQLSQFLFSFPSTQPAKALSFRSLQPQCSHLPTAPLHPLRDVIESKLAEFLDSGRAAVEDLQTLVRVDGQTRRVVISCRRSTVQFLGTLFLSSIVIVFSLRAFVKLVALGLGRNYGEGKVEMVYRRDRSLGGKEVLVAKRERSEVRSNKKRIDILGSIEEEDESFEWMRGMRLPRRSSSVKRLPKWWPPNTDSSQGLMEFREENQRMANMLVRAILDNRMSGKDVLEDDIIQLRRICKTSKVRVSFDTEHARDSLYRTSVDYVLNYCESTGNQPGFVQINGEDVQKFIAGLADNIALENTRAARMVSAAVAARTRSRLLQAWALEMQSRHAEAVEELQKIRLIHQIFPPDEYSPEMEMVARGLKKHLNLEQREFLMNTFKGICGESSGRSVAEALGLMHSQDDAVYQQEAKYS